MKKNRIFKSVIAGFIFCMMFSMTVLAEEDQDMKLLSVEKAEEDVLVYADGQKHGTVDFDPTMYANMTYSNNTKISLLFNVRSFGVDTDYFVIRIYRGSDTEKGIAVARKSEEFSSYIGSYNYTYEWDTTDVTKYTPGTYTITCSAYAGDDTQLGNTEKISVTLQDYKLILDKQFVERLYNKVFQRNADAVGLADWSSRLYNGTTTGATTVEGFFGSIEFDKKNTSNEEYIDILYAAIFDRDADEEGTQYWLDVLNQGFSRTYVLRGFIGSGEFRNLCQKYGIIQGDIVLTENRDQNVGVTEFVSRLYSIALGRKADASGLNDWTGRLLSKKETPQNVAYGFVFSVEMNNRHLNNTEFVTLLYQTMMDRNPDEGGLKDWVGKLENGTAREVVFRGFADSVEFANIVKSYGL